MSKVAGRPVTGEMPAGGTRDPGSEAAAGGRTDADVTVRRIGGRRRWWRDARRRRMLALADLVATSVASTIVSLGIGSPWPFAFLPLWLLVAKLFGLYDRDHKALRHLTADEVPALIAWAATVSALLALLLPLTPASGFGSVEAFEFFVVVVIAAVVARAVARRLWWSWTPPEHVGMIGDEPGLQSMRRKLGLFRDMHFELAVEQRIDGIGSGPERTRDLLAIVDRVDRVIVAADHVDSELIAQLNAICRRRQVKLSVVSPLRGRAFPSLQISQLADLPILEYNTWDVSRSSLWIKRAFDVAVAAIGVLCLIPLLPVIALAIKLDSPGPVFFSQVRAGLGGRPFRIYKFRTMRVDAKEVLDEVVRL